MSDTILSGDFTVYYGAENRQKRIVWTGSDTGTRTINELYSALQDLFDELTQMDDGVPMSAQTPTEYTIGIIDTGDKDPWFIDRTTVEHLYGGALKTAEWQRDLPGDGTGNVGIVKVTCNNTNIVAGDIGETISHDTDLDSGTLLDVKGTGAGSTLWIRPANNALANDWNSTSGGITCNTHTATQSAAAVSAGESLWANIYSIGAIENYTHIYVYQDGAYLTAYKDTQSDWWSDKTTGLSTDHIDILINVQELGAETDEGWIKVYARQYSKTYSYYTVDLITTAGVVGRNPIPLQTGTDLDNPTGYSRMTMTASVANFDVGNYIYWTNSGANTWATTTKRGVITAIDTDNNYIYYYLLGEPITDFSASDTVIQEYVFSTQSDGDGSGTITASAPVVAVPATTSGTTFWESGTPATLAFGGMADGGSFDVDENGTNENYSIVIDCNQNSVGKVYQWTKYITRRNLNADDIDPGAATVIGESYIGSDYKISGYTSDDGTITTGTVVTQAGTGATGTCTNHNSTDDILILRDSRGTFTAGGGNITGGGVTINPTGATIATITPISAAPFGTFAGGKFFCAPGVYLNDRLDSDLNNFQLVDDGGTVRLAPIKVNVTVNKTIEGDRIAVFRLTGSGGDIEKNYYTCVGGEAAGGTSLTVNQTIRIDEPGKTVGGVLRIVDDSANTEYRIRFASWSGSVFTLDSTTGLTSDATGNTTTHIQDTGAFATAKVGDLIRRTANGAVGYITEVVDDDNVNMTTVTGFTNTDGYEINTLPIAPEATNDTLYVPFIDVHETTGSIGSEDSETVQVVYDTTVFTRVRARHSTAAPRMIPFEQDSTITSNGMTVSVIRSTDTIFS